MKIITADISASQYISQFRDVDKFIGFCRQCGNYGNSWLCPPFDYDIDEKLRPWTKVHVAGVTVDVAGKHQLSEAMVLLQPARIELSRYLLEKEQESKGLAFGFSGKCHYCNECGRPQGVPCRHTDKARPSLEAYGFDVGATAEQLLGIQLQWGKDGYLPEQLALIGAVFMP